MKRLPIVAVLLVLIALIGMPIYEKQRKQEIQHGKVLFQLHCCGCHNGRRTDLAKLPPNLSGIFQQPRLPSGAPATDGAVRSSVLVGRSDIMPSFRDSLDDEEIDTIILYLHSVGPETPACTTN